VIRSIKQLAPNGATIANLSAGFLAIALAVEGKQDFAALLIIAAVLFDSIDGVLARMFDVSCRFGAEMDSLADVVSFGVAPAVVVGSLMPDLRFAMWIVLAAFPVCAALRLARFNIRNAVDGPHMGFLGLPSTGAGGCVAASVLMREAVGSHGTILLPCLLLLLAALMISNFPYSHVGGVIARFPVASVVAGVLLMFVGAVYWHYELVFVVFFWGYALAGPTLAVKEKIKALREAHSS